jgi:hypothetical protein
MKMADLWVVAPCTAMMMGAVRNCETLMVFTLCFASQSILFLEDNFLSDC